MVFPQSSNVEAFRTHLQSGSVGIDVYGTSQIAGQPSASGQGWDNVFYGLLRQWDTSLAPLRGFSMDHWRDAVTYTPSPDQSGSVQHPTANMDQKKPNAAGGNTWSPGAIDTGVLGMLNGTEIAGQTAGTQQLIKVTWPSATMSSMSGTPVHGVLTGSAVRLKGIFHHHTDGMDCQLQLVITGATNVAQSLDTGSGTGITATSTGTTDASSATVFDAVVRQTAGQGDQTGAYGRLGQLILEDTAVTGVTITGCGIGGATLTDIGHDKADSPAGLCDDADFTAYRAATGATAAIVMAARNNSSDSEATINSYYDTLLARLNTAGYTHVLVVGEFQDSGLSTAQVEAINQAAYDAATDSALTASFVSLYALDGSSEIDAGYIESGSHPNQSGADYLAGLLVNEMLGQAGGPRQRLRRRGRKRNILWR